MFSPTIQRKKEDALRIIFASAAKCNPVIINDYSLTGDRQMIYEIATKWRTVGYWFLFIDFFLFYPLSGNESMFLHSDQLDSAVMSFIWSHNNFAFDPNKSQALRSAAGSEELSTRTSAIKVVLFRRLKFRILRNWIISRISHRRCWLRKICCWQLTHSTPKCAFPAVWTIKIAGSVLAASIHIFSFCFIIFEIQFQY